MRRQREGQGKRCRVEETRLAVGEERVPGSDVRRPEGGLSRGQAPRHEAPEGLVLVEAVEVVEGLSTRDDAGEGEADHQQEETEHEEVQARRSHGCAYLQPARSLPARPSVRAVARFPRFALSQDTMALFAIR